MSICVSIHVDISIYLISQQICPDAIGYPSPSLAAIGEPPLHYMSLSGGDAAGGDAGEPLIEDINRMTTHMLDGWVNPHREQHIIP